MYVSEGQRSGPEKGVPRVRDTNQIGVIPSYSINSFACSSSMVLSEGLNAQIEHLLSSLHAVQIAPWLIWAVCLAVISMSLSRVLVMGSFKNQASLRRVALPLELNSGVYAICSHLLPTQKGQPIK